MIIIGSLLFMAGYDYTRRQAEYAANQGVVTKTAQTKNPEVLPSKPLPSFVFRADNSLSGSTYN